MNIKELVQFCKEIKGKTHKEALKIGDKHGVSHCGVDALRKILGYSDGSRINKLSPEERDRIADEYREGGVTLGFLSCVACYELHFIFSNGRKSIDGQKICRSVYTSDCKNE